MSFLSADLIDKKKIVENMTQDWSQITTQALYDAWESVLLFLPIIGRNYFHNRLDIAIWIGKLVSSILNKLKFNSILKEQDGKTFS